MLGITMPVVYWPLRALAAVGARLNPSWSRPRTIFVSRMEMMLMAELPKVMGTPMARIRLTSVPPEDGTSRLLRWSRWVKR